MQVVKKDFGTLLEIRVELVVDKEVEIECEHKKEFRNAHWNDAYFVREAIRGNKSGLWKEVEDNVVD